MKSDREDNNTNTDDTSILLQQKCSLPITCSSLSPLSLHNSPRKSIRKLNTYPRRKSIKNNNRVRSSCKRKLKFNELSLSSSSSEASMDLRNDPFLEEIDVFLNNIKQNHVNPSDIKLSTSISPSKLLNSSTKSNITRDDVERTTNDLQSMRLQRNYYEDLEENSRNDYKYSNPANVPSLSSLWDKCSTDSYHTLNEKYKEEQMRRQHCEKTILELQEKALEDKQKIAVAVEIDDTKNAIIEKLRSTCKYLSSRISEDREKYKKEMDRYIANVENVKEENFQLQTKLENMQSTLLKLSDEESKISEKNKSLELEMLCMAKNHQDNLEKLKEGFKDKEDRLAELKESHKLLVHVNKQFSDNIHILQENLDKANKSKSKFENELNILKKQHTELTDENTVLIMEKNDLKNKLTEETIRNQHLDNQKNQFQSSLKSLEKDFEDYKRQIEQDHLEIKGQYQKQVENIVLNKLKEFQHQLNNAEMVMESEIKNKEHSIASSYANQLQKIEQQHKTEIKIIEERHKEEMKYYNLQLNKSSKKIQQLEDYISSYKQKRGYIAAQLHSVMENQWQQALKIITNSSESENGITEVPKQNKFLNDNSEMKKDVKSANDGNLEDYIKLLLQKPPSVHEQKFELNQNNNAKSSESNTGNFLTYQNMEYPTQDKNFESEDRRNNFKPPWK